MTSKIKSPTFGNGEILLIGEAPGREEITQGRPFCGPSGGLITSILRNFGLQNNVTFANVCNYRPLGNDIKTFFPKKSDYYHNGKYITHELHEGIKDIFALIESGKYKKILLLGKTPLWAILNEDGKISDFRGSMYLVPTSNGLVPTIPTFHPAYILRNYQDAWLLSYDINRLLESTPNDFLRKEYQLHPEPNWEKEHYAFDIETSYPGTNIICMGIAWGPRDGFVFSSMNNPKALHEFLFKLQKKKLIMHNGNFDRAFVARNYGFRLPLAFDTMTGHHLNFPDLAIGGKSLNFISSLYRKYHHYWKDTRNSAEMIQYNLTDCCATYECWQGISKILTQRGLM